jgi:dihydrofolate reductase
MRQLKHVMHISLDGYYADSNGEMRWVRMDNDLGDYVHQYIAPCGTAIYGRTTYEMMENFWPNAEQHPQAKPGSHLVEHARWVNPVDKILISRTRKTANWQPTTIISENVVAAIKELKEQPGKDMVLLASASIARLLMSHGLIDQYLISITPVALGGGQAFFHQPLNLKLVDATSFSSGVMAGIYEPA